MLQTHGRFSPLFAPRCATRFLMALDRSRREPRAPPGGGCRHGRSGGVCTINKERATPSPTCFCSVFIGLLARCDNLNPQGATIDFYFCSANLCMARFAKCCLSAALV